MPSSRIFLGARFVEQARGSKAGVAHVWTDLSEFSPPTGYFVLATPHRSVGKSDSQKFLREDATWCTFSCFVLADESEIRRTPAQMFLRISFSSGAARSGQERVARVLETLGRALPTHGPTRSLLLALCSAGKRESRNICVGVRHLKPSHCLALRCQFVLVFRKVVSVLVVVGGGNYTFRFLGSQRDF